MLRKFIADEPQKWDQCYSPYKVSCQEGLVDYEVHQLDRWKPKQIYHINLLKLWKDRVAEYPDKLELGLPEEELGSQQVVELRAQLTDWQ